MEKDLQEYYRQRNEEIRNAYNTGQWSLVELAKKYILTRQRVYKIVNENK